MSPPELEPDSVTTFGELLKDLRRRARLTQKELGIAVGYSEAYIARLEGNQRRPDIATVRTRLVEALGLQREPALAQRLIELAQNSRTEDASGAYPVGDPRLTPHAPPTFPLN
jgi:transcriptional regulator with XRE-family HTH domain